MAVGKEEQPMASRDSELLQSTENSSTKLSSPWLGDSGLAPVGCFLALGFLSRDPLGRPILTGCR